MCWIWQPPHSLKWAQKGFTLFSALTLTLIASPLAWPLLTSVIRTTTCSGGNTPSTKTANFL